MIIVQAFHYQLDLHSSYFIIDGHHKLLAYQKLGIYPSMALITYQPSSAEEIEFDAEKLSTLLYPWQIKDLLKNWDEKDTYVVEKLKNPNSPLHQFVKNGLVKEYHPNKKPKHEAFYINDKVDGKSLEWFDNGQLKHEHFYSNGKRIGIWKDYYPSGKIQFVQPFDDMNRYDGDMVSYYENGQRRWIQSLKNGRNTDGFTYLCWFENGDKEAELKYLDGQIIERKNWNSLRQFVNHEVYDEEQKRLVKKIITINSSYQNTQNQPSMSSEKNLNLIRERQYPQTSYKDTWRWVAILLLLLLQFLRMCHL